MIRELNRKLTKRFRLNLGISETRQELKKKLDYFATENITLKELSDCLREGAARSFEITENRIVVSMQTQGTKYYWKRVDPRTAIACLVVVGEYEILETEILKFFSRNANTVIDVGANVGYYVVELSQVLRANGTIHAFEPVPNSFEQLTLNIELNGISSIVKCNQVALSNADGIIHLYLPETSGSSASSARNLHPAEKVKEFDVPATTLDSYISQNKLTAFDLLKIDVEGAELSVIQGALQSIEQYKPVIFAELLRKWSAQFNYHPNDVLRLLSSLGYQCFAVSELFPEIFEVTDETVETNFLFIQGNRISEIEHLRDHVVPVK